jgi:hypothetical protein
LWLPDTAGDEEKHGRGVNAVTDTDDESLSDGVVVVIINKSQPTKVVWIQLFIIVFGIMARVESCESIEDIFCGRKQIVLSFRLSCVVVFFFSKQKANKSKLCCVIVDIFNDGY